MKALLRIAGEIAPDVVAVSGDLTQRARHREFAAAREFLERLPGVKVVVPGNHDIPLYNVVVRVLAPLARYRRHMGTASESAFVDDEIAVVGVNSARSLVFKGGRINLEQASRVRKLLCGRGERVRVLVAHHPFHLPGRRGDGDLVGRAAQVLDHLRECMPDVLLGGHMHSHEVATTAQRYDLDGRSAIVVQAGTATSTRGRGEENSFNLLHVERDVIEIERWDWRAAARIFAPVKRRRFRRNGSAWNEDVTATPDPSP